MKDNCEEDALYLCDGNTSGIAEKPNRPLNSYNLFFRYHRDLILNGKVESSDIYNAPLAITASEIANIDVSKRYDNGKRRNHRRTHGKIGFTDLSKIISHRWKTCDSFTRMLFENRAAQEKSVYDEQMSLYLEQLNSIPSTDGTQKRRKKNAIKEMRRKMSPDAHIYSTKMYSTNLHDLHLDPCTISSSFHAPYSITKPKHSWLEPLPCTVDRLPRISVSDPAKLKSTFISSSNQDYQILECDESYKKDKSPFASFSLEDLIEFNKKYVLKRTQSQSSSSEFDESDVVMAVPDTKEELVDDLSMIENIVSSCDQDMFWIANSLPFRSGSREAFIAPGICMPVTNAVSRSMTTSSPHKIYDDEDDDDRLANDSVETIAHFYPPLVRNGRVINEADLIRFNLESIRRNS